MSGTGVNKQDNNYLSNTILENPTISGTLSGSILTNTTISGLVNLPSTTNVVLTHNNNSTNLNNIILNIGTINIYMINGSLSRVSVNSLLNTNSLLNYNISNNRNTIIIPTTCQNLMPKLITYCGRIFNPSLSSTQFTTKYMQMITNSGLSFTIDMSNNIIINAYTENNLYALLGISGVPSDGKNEYLAAQINMIL